MKRPEGFDAAAKSRGDSLGAEQSSKARRTRTKKVPSMPVSEKGPADKPFASQRLRAGRVSPPARAPRGGAALARASARERHRFERREVRRFTRRSRHRRLAWLVALGVVVSLVGLLGVAVYSPVLALRSITVDGVSKVNADDVRVAIAGQMGTPLALLDYDVVRSELDAFPLIRSFSTEIVPPSTLKIHIVERAPVGVVSSPSGFSVVDPAGVVLESTPRRPEGIPLIDLAGGDTNSVAFAAVVDVLLALPDSIRSRVDVAQATSKDDVRLVLADAGQRVRWGSSERSALKARVLVELMATQDGGANIEFDVSAPMSPVVRSN